MNRVDSPEPSDRPQIIDCVTHCLTGPAILAAAGILSDGTLLRAKPNRIPYPALLLLPLNSAEKKIGVLRVALSKIYSREVGRYRTFGLQFGSVIQTVYQFQNAPAIPIDMMVMNFTQGNRMMQIARAIENYTIGALK